jgi:hypothetical protein
MRVKMNNIKYFNSIKTQYKRSLIYTRLGFEKTNTSIEPEQKKQIEKWITEAEFLCKVSVIFRTVCLSTNQKNKVILTQHNETMISKSLWNLLQNSKEAILMAATAGVGIMDEIKQLQEAGNMTKAIVYDAAASQITDAGLDWVMAYSKQQLIRKGASLTHMRYSPGYGDLELYNQDIFYRLLNLENWGVEITENYMLIPEKTVTAIVGIESPKS